VFSTVSTENASFKLVSKVNRRSQTNLTSSCANCNKTAELDQKTLLKRIIQTLYLFGDASRAWTAASCSRKTDVTTLPFACTCTISDDLVETTKSRTAKVFARSVASLGYSFFSESLSEK